MTIRLAIDTSASGSTVAVLVEVLSDGSSSTVVEVTTTVLSIEVDVPSPDARRDVTRDGDHHRRGTGREIAQGAGHRRPERAVGRAADEV